MPATAALLGGQPRAETMQYVLVGLFSTILAIIRPWADTGSLSLAFSLRRYVYATTCTCVPIVYVQLRLFKKQSSAAMVSCGVTLAILSFDVCCFVWSPVEELLAETDKYLQHNTVFVASAYLVLGIGLPIEPLRFRHRLVAGVALVLLRGVSCLVISSRISAARLQHLQGDSQTNLFLTTFVGTAGVFLMGALAGSAVVGAAPARVEPQATEGERLLSHLSDTQPAGAQPEPPAEAPTWLIVILAAVHAVPFSVVAAACGAPVLPRDMTSPADWLRTSLISGGIIVSSLKIASLVCEVRPTPGG